MLRTSNGAIIESCERGDTGEPFAGLTGAQSQRAEHPNSNERWADMNRDRWKSIGAHAVGLWETASRGATYNPLSPGVLQNPYKAYDGHGRASPPPSLPQRAFLELEFQCLLAD